MSVRSIMMSYVCIIAVSFVSVAVIPASGPADLPDSSMWGHNIPKTMTKLVAGQPVKVLFIGQSITAGLWPPEMIDTLKARYPSATVTYVNQAQSACDATCMDPLLQAKVQGQNPDVIIFQIYGWETPYAQCISDMQKYAPNAEFALVSNHVDALSTPQDHVFNAYMSDYFIPEMARKANLGFIDVHHAWERYMANHTITANQLLLDDQHPNADGDLLMARMIASYFVPADSDHTPPAVDSASARSSTRIVVYFSEEVDSATACNPANYTVSGATVQSAQRLWYGRTVVLHTTARPAGNQTLSVTNVLDKAPVPNTIVPGAGIQISTAASYDWNSVDIGTYGAPGTTTHTAGTNSFILTSCADNTNIFKNELHYVYKPVSGDCQISGRITALTGGNANRIAGVCIREVDEYYSNFVMLGFKNPDTCVVLSRNKSPSQGPINITSVVGSGTPRYLRVTRSGNTFTPEQSSNGTIWTQVGAALTVPMGVEATAGLFAFSGNYDPAVKATATFDSVGIAGGIAAVVSPLWATSRGITVGVKLNRHTLSLTNVTAGAHVMIHDLRGALLMSRTAEGNELVLPTSSLGVSTCVVRVVMPDGAIMSNKVLLRP